MNKKMIMIVLAVLVIAAVAVVLYMTVFSGDGTLPYVYTEYTPGEYFVTNAKDSSRLVKITVVLQLNTDTLEKFLTEREASIRDTIGFILRDTGEADFKSKSGLLAMGERIVSELNEMLEIDNITGVLFYDFVLQ